MACIYAQTRNDQVRTLNTIVDYMDESSRINRELYWDIKQFAEGYIHSSRPKRNDNYWYTHANPGMRISSYDNAQRFPEIHLDAEGMFSDFEFILYPYLQERENIDKLLAGKFFNNKDSLKNSLLDFKYTMDSLVILHHRLYDYVTNKNYLTDFEFKAALDIIEQTSQILDHYHQRAYHLYDNIREYYLGVLPRLKTQERILEAKDEAFMIIVLLEQWEARLFKGDTSYNHPMDLAVRKFNKASLANDSIIFYGSYGYKVSNNGAMPHTRYCTFYSMMKTTLYWYVKDKYHYPEFMKKSDINYNEFVDRTHMVIEDYNDLIECADGKQLSKNLDYSMKMAAQIGVDTNQNVLLKWPRWSYIFHFVKPGEEKPPVQDRKDTAVTEHQQLINKSSPHHMVFLLDVSASMHDPGKLDLLKEGAKYLVGLQRKTDHISLLTFSTHSHILLRNMACDQKTRINTKIDELQTHGATNASEGIRHAFDIADSNMIANGKNKIILVTDGKFQLDGDASKLLGSFKKKNIELVILLIGTKEDAPTIDKDFEKMSKKGNGRYYKVQGKNLEEVLIKEAAD